MSRTPRLALALALAVTGVTAFGASAAPAPKPVCNLITDPTGDVTVPSANLDIVSADIASDARRLTGVIRVSKLATSDGTAPTGVAYSFYFKLPGSAVQYYLLASVEPAPVGATTFEFGTVETGNSLTPIGPATGVIDLAKSEVRITAPTTLGSVKVKPGSKIVSLQAFTQRRFVVLLSGADSTELDESKTYTAGTRSCVTPGA
ncbi:MAG: hypothetical protein H7323_05090 [Frankiales bacterium]|nr:hypothetical protein [Frankiales bacterium]